MAATRATTVVAEEMTIIDMTKVSGYRFQVSVVAILVFIVIFAVTYNLQPTTSLAQQTPLSIQFTPGSGDLKAGDEKIIKLTLSSDAQISGMDLKFQTSGINITDFRDALETDTKLNPFETKQVIETLDPQSPQASYIFSVPPANLPKVVTLYMKIKGTTTGEGKITLDYNHSQVLNGQGNLLQIQPNQSATYKINLTQSSPDFINPASVPAANYPASTAKVNLKLKLFGAGKVSGPLKATAIAVGNVGSRYQTLPQSFDLVQQPNGTFAGDLAFPNFKDGTKFSLMIKVDKYLLRRICNADAAETKPQGYRCTDPALTIRQGDNSFDFTKIQLLPGDLGIADGVLNGYDLSLVRNNLNKNTKQAVALSDLNYDGKVDETDYKLIGFVAANTSGEGDQ